MNAPVFLPLPDELQAVLFQSARHREEQRRAAIIAAAAAKARAWRVLRHARIQSSNPQNVGGF